MHVQHANLSVSVLSGWIGTERAMAYVAAARWLGAGRNLWHALPPPSWNWTPFWGIPFHTINFLRRKKPPTCDPFQHLRGVQRMQKLNCWLRQAGHFASAPGSLTHGTAIARFCTWPWEDRRFCTKTGIAVTTLLVFHRETLNGCVTLPLRASDATAA